MIFLLAGLTGLVVVLVDHTVRRHLSPALTVLLVLYGILAAVFLVLAVSPAALAFTMDEPWPGLLAGGFTAMALTTGWERARAWRAQRRREQ